MKLIVVFSFLICTTFCAENITINCKYTTQNSQIWNEIPYNYKACKVDGDLIIARNSRVVSVVEIDGYPKDSIGYFYSYEKTMKYIPKGFGEIFPNLIFLNIEGSKLVEVSADDMKQFPNLHILAIQSNPIEYLEANLFKHNPDLHWIRLWSNKITHIDVEAFSGLYYLEYLDLRKNPCVDSEVNNQSAIQNLIHTAANICKDKFLHEFYQAKMKKLCNDKMNIFQQQIDVINSEIKNLEDECPNINNKCYENKINNE